MHVRNTLLGLSVLLLSTLATGRAEAGSWSIDRGNSWLGIEGNISFSSSYSSQHARAGASAYVYLQLLKERKQAFVMSASAQTGVNSTPGWHPRNPHSKSSMKVAGYTVSLDRNTSTTKKIGYSKNLNLFSWDKIIMVAGIVPVTIDISVTLDFDAELEAFYNSAGAVVKTGVSTGLTGSLDSNVYFAVAFGPFVVPTRIAVRCSLTLMGTTLEGRGTVVRGGEYGRVDLDVIAARFRLKPMLQYLGFTWTGTRWKTWKQTTLVDKSYGKFTKRLF